MSDEVTTRKPEDHDKLNGRYKFMDVAVSGGECYFRWVYDAKFKTFKKGQVFRSYGMSHIRFDETGRVVFHVDYWDSASGLLEPIPLLGGLIKLIKRRI